MDESKRKEGIRVFVYGTLKDGHSNNYALQEGGAEFLGRCVLSGDYRLVDLGWFPAVLNCEDDRRRDIFGEVYLVDEETLYSLDLIEGHPNFYKRVKVPTEYGNAWLYVLQETGNDYDSVDSGVWNPLPPEQEFVEEVRSVA